MTCIQPIKCALLRVAVVALFFLRLLASMLWIAGIFMFGIKTVRVMGIGNISGHPSAAGRAQDRESSPARDRHSTTVPRHQLKC